MALPTVDDRDRYQDLKARHDAVEAQPTTCRNELASLTQSISAARAHVSTSQADTVRTRRELEGTVKSDLADFSKHFLGQYNVEFERIKKVFTDTSGGVGRSLTSTFCHISNDLSEDIDSRVSSPSGGA